MKEEKIVQKTRLGKIEYFERAICIVFQPEFIKGLWEKKKRKRGDIGGSRRDEKNTTRELQNKMP